MNSGAAIGVLLAVALSLQAEVKDQVHSIPFADNNGNFGVLAKKVQDRETVRIGYIGGSITQGTGAGTYADTYYYRSSHEVLSAIKAKGGNAKFFCAAVPGTDSCYGAHRACYLLRDNLDLLIVEFAVNDIGNARAVEGMEGIVRQTLKYNPDTAIVFFYTCTRASVTNDYAEGKSMPSVVLQHRVAEHYKIPEVNCGPKLAALYSADKSILKAFFIKDGIHPSPLGHDYYAKWLSSAIISGLNLPGTGKAAALPPPLSTDNMENAGLINAEPASKQGEWKYINPQLWRPCGTWLTHRKNAEMTFHVQNAVGLLFSFKNTFLYRLPGMKDFKKAYIRGFPAAVSRPFIFGNKVSGDITIKNIGNQMNFCGVWTQN